MRVKVTPKFFLSWVLAMATCPAIAQVPESSFKQKTFALNTDTIYFDSLSIAPQSMSVVLNGDSIPKDSLYIDYINAYLAVPGNLLSGNNRVQLTYRTFPLKLNRELFHKDIDSLKPRPEEVTNPFKYRYQEKEEAPWQLTGLSKEGSISRGVSFGNNQNLSVNSNLNLQLAGKLTDNISVLAAISDENIPIQPEGNTQQLQDFDKVYIQLYDEKSKLTAGDFALESPDSYFMKYFKRAQGGSFNTNFNTSNGGEMDLQASAAVSRGKFARSIIQGVEGNQGPYRLRGAENEQFIVILSGTERVYVDGKLLTRGQENDYVINYNTAEITFTARQLVTKDKRIIVEFQYSVLNYQRSLFQFSNSYKKDNYKLDVNFYSEQDNKNQPIQRDLDEDDRALLAEIGDSLDEATIPSADTANYSDNRVLYELQDTLVNGNNYDSIYVFSQSREVQLYEVTFSEVGQGNGNYILSNSIANGRVYEWVAPVSGVPQGRFAPKVLIQTPKQQQMMTVGAEVDLEKTKVKFEGAVTNNDINTFSDKATEDDYGAAFKTDVERKFRLGGPEKNGWQLKSGVGAEFWNRHFNAIERVRSVEFYRDWNLRGVTLREDQKIGSATMGIEKGQAFDLTYKINAFDAGTDFNGIKNDFSILTRWKGLTVDYKGSLLNSEGKRENTGFYQHNSLVKQSAGLIVLGYRDDLENNLRRSPVADTLSRAAYRFFEYEFFATNQDTAKNNYKVSYIQRRDYGARNDEIVLATFGEAFGFSFDLLKNPNSTLSGKATYRTLDIRDSTLTQNDPDNTLLGRLEYRFRILKGTIQSTSFYEIGSGLESRKEYTFVEVPAGQGTYTWNDYNDNGIKELNEFEIAAFQDQATYIKVFYPTDNYVKTYTNQFNQTLNVNPAAVWSGEEGFKKFVSRFSDQVAYRIDRKTGQTPAAKRFNPFLQEYQIADSNLISLNSSLRNSLYFNRTAPVFGAEFTVQNVRGKTLLTNGFESRSNESYTGGFRVNFSKSFAFNGEYTQGVKSNLSDFFSTRDYTIDYYEAHPKLSYQPSTKYRISVFFKYKEKLNQNDEIRDPFGEVLSGKESSIFRTIGSEVRLASLGKGNLTANLNFVNITYTGPENSPVAYEMLEGLQNGKNYTWTLYYQRTLANNLQVDINYTGRASANNQTVHTGGIQVRAYF